MSKIYCPFANAIVDCSSVTISSGTGFGAVSETARCGFYMSAPGTKWDDINKAETFSGCAVQALGLSTFSFFTEQNKEMKKPDEK